MIELDKLQNYIEHKQNQPISGLPIKIYAWREQLGSVEKGSFVMITSGTAGAKTSFTLEFFVFDLITFANQHPELKLKIDFFSLEETQLRTDLRILSRLYYEATGKQFSLKDFQNADNSKKVLPYIKDLGKAQSLVDTFNKHCTIHGDCKTVEEIEARINQSIKQFPDSEDSYHLVIIDNLKFLKTSLGRTIKETIDYLTLFLLLRFRDKNNIIPIIVQHQSAGSDVVKTNYKGEIILQSIRPSENTLSDSNDTRTPVTTIIGIYCPYEYGLKYYPDKDGYDLEVWGDKLRVICGLKMRDGGTQDLVMYFNGKICKWQELEPPEYFRKNGYGKYNLNNVVKTKPKWEDELSLLKS